MRTLSWVLVSAVGMGTARADDSAKKPPEPSAKPTPAERLKALETEQAKAMNAFMKEYQTKKTDKERRQLVDEKYPDPSKNVEKYVEIAKEDPAGEVGAKACILVIQNGSQGKHVDFAFRALREHHLKNPGLKSIVPGLGYSMSPEAEKLLLAIIDSETPRAMKASATIALAQKFGMMAERKKLASENPLQAMAQGLSGSSQDKRTAKELETEAERLYEKVVKDFADVKNSRGDLISDQAVGALFEMRQLSIGKTAPEIVGEDIDGKTMKLSEYRGKVVVLDFWGDW